MFETLRTWLNGNKEYFTGLAIFKYFSRDTRLLILLQHGNSKYNSDRLQNELMEIYISMKQTNTPVQDEEDKCETVKIVIQPPLSVKELYDTTHTRAMKLYKECMNKRALLFQLTKVEDWQDANAPDKVAERSKLAIEVVQLYNQASTIFDVADYVEKNNRLPNEIVTDELESFNDLPDHLVKLTLTNARKALNKHKGKEATLERLALIKKHTSHIEILERKWHLLNSGKIVT